MTSPAGPRPPANYANQGPNILGCGIVMITIPTIAVTVRLWSRIALRKGFWWDDWLVLALMVFSHAYLALNIWWTTIGLGKHSWMVPFGEITNNDIANRVSLTLYSVAITLIKVSALTLYARLFQINSRFKISLWVLGIVIVAWGIVLVVLPWTFCHPLSHNVDPLGPGYCTSEPSWYLGSAFVNAFFDLVVLFLPMPIVWRLQLRLKRKILISSVLILGYCSAFLSFARFIIIVRDPGLLASATDSDPSWNLIPILYLSMLESPFALFALCGPPWYQLLQRYAQFGFRSLFSTRQYLTPLADDSYHGRNNSGKERTGSGSIGLSSKWSEGNTSTVLSREDRLLRKDASETELELVRGKEEVNGIRVERGFKIEAARDMV